MLLLVDLGSVEKEFRGSCNLSNTVGKLPVRGHVTPTARTTAPCRPSLTPELSDRGASVAGGQSFLSPREVGAIRCGEGTWHPAVLEITLQDAGQRPARARGNAWAPPEFLTVRVGAENAGHHLRGGAHQCNACARAGAHQCIARTYGLGGQQHLPPVSAAAACTSRAPATKLRSTDTEALRRRWSVSPSVLLRLPRWTSTPRRDGEPPMAGADAEEVSRTERAMVEYKKDDASRRRPGAPAAAGCTTACMLAVSPDSGGRAYRADLSSRRSGPGSGSEDTRRTAARVPAHRVFR
nr:unnamed protein product [Digitaria exilis]